MPTLSEIEAAEAAAAAAGSPAPPPPPRTLGEIEREERKERKKKRGLLDPEPLIEDGEQQLLQPRERTGALHSDIARAGVHAASDLTVNALKEVGRTAVGVSQLGGAALSQLLDVVEEVRDAEEAEPARADPYSTLAAKIVAGTRAGALATAGKVARAATLPDRAGEVLARVPDLVARGAEKLREDPLGAAGAIANTLYENPIGTASLASLGVRSVARAALPVVQREITKDVVAAGERAAEKAAAAGVEVPEVFADRATQSLAHPLQRFVPALEGAAEAPIRSAVEAVKGQVREHHPALAEAGGFARGQAEMRELRGLEASAELARNNKFTNAVVDAFKIPDEELDSFARIIQGIDPLPADASPGLRKAIEWARTHDVQQTSDLVRRGWLTPDEAMIRAYAPLRINRFAAQAGGDMKAAYRREARLIGKAEKEALRETRAQEKRYKVLRSRYIAAASRMEGLEATQVQAGARKTAAQAGKRTSEAERNLRELDDELAALTKEHMNLSEGARQMALEGTPPPGAMVAQTRRGIESRLGRRESRLRPGSASQADLHREVREAFLAEDFGTAAKKYRALARQIENNLARQVRLRTEAGEVLGTAARISSTGSGPAHQELLRLSREIEAERFFYGKPEPIYFHHMPAEATGSASRAHVITEEVKRRMPSSLQRSVGRLFAFDEYEKNPRVVYVRHERELNRWRRNENIINTVLAEPERFGLRLIKKMKELRADEVLFTPDLPKEVAAKNLRFSQVAASDPQSIDNGFYAALKDAVRESNNPQFRDLMKQGRLYAMPRAAAHELINQYRPTPWFIRAFWDRPTDYWRTLTLALRPAWAVNNALGNFLFSVMHGVGPKHWKMALQEEWIARTPDELGTGGLSREAAMASALDLASEGDPAFARQVAGLYQKLEQHPASLPISRTADALKSFNSYIEDVSRRANFWKAADKQARLAYVKRTGDRFYRSFELAQEYDRLDAAGVRAAIRETNAFMNDYVNGLTWYERSMLRRAVPFVSFLKHQLRLQLMLPTDYPGRTAALKALVLMNGEVDDDAKIPTSMRNQGVIRFPNTFQVGNRRLRLYMSTMGANPLIIGSGPSASNEISTDPRELYAMLVSQAHPAIQAGDQYRTRKDVFGHPFTHPRVVEREGRWFQRDEAGRLTEVQAPIPSVPEAAARAVPQSRLIRALIEPRATWTAAPFSTEPKVDERSLTEATRLSTALAYLGIPVVLVDENTGERFIVREDRPPGPRVRRAVMREFARRRRLKEDE